MYLTQCQDFQLILIGTTSHESISILTEITNYNELTPGFQVLEEGEGKRKIHSKADIFFSNRVLSFAPAALLQFAIA